MVNPSPIDDSLAALSHLLMAQGTLLCTAESCTGGLIAARCTDIAGSSRWFERGFVTYSNAAKTELLGVAPELLATWGAVSEPVARAMVAGAIGHSRAQVGVAVTGIAGPDGGTTTKPVGTVWIAWAVNGAITSQCFEFKGDRRAVREQTVQWALGHLASLLQSITTH